MTAVGSSDRPGPAPCPGAAAIPLPGAPGTTGGATRPSRRWWRRTAPERFREIAAGLLRYELVVDIGEQVGDELTLLEYTPAGRREPEGYTGGVLRARITHKTPGGHEVIEGLRLPDEVAVLGFALLREGGEG